MNDRRIFLTLEELILEGALPLDSLYSGNINAIYVPLSNDNNYLRLGLYLKNGSYYNLYTYSSEHSFSTYSSISTIDSNSYIELSNTQLKTIWSTVRTQKGTTTTYTNGSYNIVYFRSLSQSTDNHGWSTSTSYGSDNRIIPYNSVDKDGNLRYLKITPQLCSFCFPGGTHNPPEGVVFRMVTNYGQNNTTGYYYV